MLSLPKKRLLFLGGVKGAIPAIDAAHTQGYYVITCDYLPNNPAHAYADEYHNVNITDKEAVFALAKELKIDGIIAFSADAGAISAAYAASKLNLPTSPYESVEILQNKDKFRSFLAEHGFNTPKAKAYSNIEEAEKELTEFTLPVIVKPVDSCGSKGVSKVSSAEELRQAAEYAINHSRTGKCIIEEFIQQKGYSSDTDSFSIDGELVFCSFNSQRFDSDAENPYVPAAYTWPSSMSAEHQKELRSELQRLMKLLNMKTTIYNIETREGIDGKAYIMEVSPRAGGNRLAEMLKLASGQDLVTNAVRAAVGDSVDELHDPIYDGHLAEYILHADKTGLFVELKLDDEFRKKYVIEEDLWVKKGENVHSYTGGNEMIGTLVMRFPTEKEMEEYMTDIKKYVEVIVS